MTKLSTCLFATIAAITGCTSSSGSLDIAPTNLAGSVGGQPWSFVAGETDGFLSQGQTDFYAELYPTQYTACGVQPTGPHLLVSIPMVAGDYDMDFERNMTFVTANQDNLATIDGRIVVDTVTATTVSGGLHGVFDGGNEVNGTFQLSICAP
jgi:hypothetical protein